MRITVFKGFLIQTKNLPFIIWIIIGIGFILRIVGISYGLPLYLNMDEPVAVSSTLLLKHSLNPEHFDWPHLYFYTLAAFYVIVVAIKFLLAQLMTLPAYFYTADIYFIGGRLFNAFLSALTILCIYLLTKKSFGKTPATIAAIIMAVLPVHVYESHFVKPDVYQTLVITIAMYFIYRIYSQKKVAIDDYLYTGVFIGLATSIKYGGVLVVFPMLIAVFLNSCKTKLDLIKKVKFLIYSGVVSIICFYIGTPFAIKEYQKFFSYERGVGALWQIHNVGSIPIETYPLEIYNKFFNMYRESLGFGVWIFFILATAMFLFFNKRDHKTLIYFMPAVLLSIYISRFERSPQHYFLFLIPMYVPYISNFIYQSIDRLLMFFKNKKIFIANTKIKENILYFFIFIVLTPSIYSSFNISKILASTDTRTLAFNWINEHLDKTTDRLYVFGSPLDSVVFEFKHVEKLKKLDVSSVEPVFPLYILIGVEDVKDSEILEGNRDPDVIKGNSEALLKNAELVYSVNDAKRLGPPIYIFKVSKFYPKSN